MHFLSAVSRAWLVGSHLNSKKQTAWGRNEPLSCADMDALQCYFNKLNEFNYYGDKVVPFQFFVSS